MYHIIHRTINEKSYTMRNSLVTERDWYELSIIRHTVLLIIRFSFLTAPAVSLLLSHLPPYLFACFSQDLLARLYFYVYYFFCASTISKTRNCKRCSLRTRRLEDSCVVYIYTACSNVYARSPGRRRRNVKRSLVRS